MKVLKNAKNIDVVETLNFNYQTASVCEYTSLCHFDEERLFLSEISPNEKRKHPESIIGHRSPAF